MVNMEDSIIGKPEGLRLAREWIRCEICIHVGGAQDPCGRSLNTSESQRGFKSADPTYAKVKVSRTRDLGVIRKTIRT